MVLAHQWENVMLELLLIQIIAGKWSSYYRLSFSISSVSPTLWSILAIRSPPADISCVIESFELSLYRPMLERLVS